MDIQLIITAIEREGVNITSHARVEARDDLLVLDDIYHATRSGEVIEDYPEDTPYPSCLIYGKNKNGDPVHCVWAFDIDSGIAVLVTVYRPDPERWIDWKVRK